MHAVKAFLLPAAVCVAIVYFSYHALAGEQGLAAWTKLQEKEEQLTAELQRLKTERAALQHSLGKLRDSTIDLDYVEEIARVRLSYARADELIVGTR
jgi:cell division protein FtsB